MLGQVRQCIVAIDAQNQGIDVIADRARKIGKAFSPAQSNFVSRQVDARAAKLGDSAFEAHAGAQAGFFEDKTNHTSAQAMRRDASGVCSLESLRLGKELSESFVW